MNCYDLFERVTLKALGVPSIDSKVGARIEDGYKYLCSAFHACAPVDYSDEHVRAAYMLVFAPRYAIAWQQYYGLDEFKFGYAGLRTPQSGAIKLNFIGSGPGSEIVGIAASAILKHLRTDVNVIDTQPAWLDALNFCLDEVESSLAVAAPNLFHSSDLSELQPQWPVVGSYVLSDIARQQTLRSFLQDVAARVPKQPALFLDTYDFQDENGKSHHLADHFGIQAQWTVHLHKRCDLRGAMGDQFGSSPRLSIQEPALDPKVAVFKFRF